MNHNYNSQIIHSETKTTETPTIRQTDVPEIKQDPVCYNTTHNKQHISAEPSIVSTENIRDPSSLQTQNTNNTSRIESQLAELSHLMSHRRKSPKQYWRSVRISQRLIRKAKVEEFQIGEDPRPHAKVVINNIEITGLLDSGASISCLGKDAYSNLTKCNLRWKEYGGAYIQTASGQSQTIDGYTDATIHFQGKSNKIRLYIVPSLTNHLYLGIDFWSVFNLLPKLEEISQVPQDADSEEDTPDMHQLDSEQKARLQEIISIFPSSEKEGLGKTTLIKHHIDVGQARPTKQRYHAVSPAIERKMYAEVDRMLELGVIEESNSAWSSPVTVVTKSNGKSRLCLDARQVNAVTAKDAYPMPLIESIVSRLSETYYISSVDLKDAFWQIELDDTSREKTAFTVSGRPLYQFVRMPFGLCNAAQSMCRLMDLAIPSNMRDCVFVYIDDLLVVSADFETHLQRLKMVAESLRKANLTINVEKSKFVMKSIRYLGHIVGNGEIKPDPGRVKCIADFPIPSSVKQVRRFLGMAGWYQRYIQGYSATAAAMTDLLKKSDRFKWTPEAQIAFESLKTSLTTAPVLKHPDFTQHFYIQCDASMTGVGGVLFQLINGDEHPVAFMSKKLNSAQRNYSVTELECLAAILCIQKFRCYVEGMPFTVITDHASLKWLMGQKDLTGRLARWSLKLQGFNFEIIHRKGSANIVPDTLSRMDVAEIDLVIGEPIDISSAEFKSENYNKIKSTIRDNQRELPDLKIQGEAVYKRTQFRTGDQTVDSSSVWKLWLPEKLRPQAIENAHHPASAAHGGTEKTTELVRRYFYWPGLSSEVRTFVSNCATCKETKAPNQTLRPPMGQAYQSERPFQRLYVDLLGPYPRSKAKNTTILIILDHLTKFVWLKPLRVATANAIVRFIESDVFHFAGAPETILTDNGVQFISKDFRTLLTRYGVHHILTASHSPQANASERVNRSILAAIRSYIDKDQTTWDVHVSAIASALRNATHATTGHTPYFAVFGHHMIQHAGSYALLRELKSLGTSDLEILPSSDYREELNKDIREKLRQAHDRNVKTYNTRTRSVNFTPGQEVFIRNFRQSDFVGNYNAKLGKQWTPARIVSKVGTSTYVVEDRSGRPIKVKYHAKDIRS